MSIEAEMFRQYGHAIVDWIDSYMTYIEQYPVPAQIVPGEISAQLPPFPFLKQEGMDTIFWD